MKRVLVAVAAVVVVVAVVVAVIGAAVAPTTVTGYRALDDYNIAVQVLGTKAQWRDVQVSETASEVTVELKQILIQGPGFDERLAYVVIALREPLGNRPVVDATTGRPIPLLPAQPSVSGP